MRKYSRICAEISLDAIDANFDMMRNRIPHTTLMAAVVKSDAYGHGAIQVARHLQMRPELWGFCCATCDEAMELRRSGISKPILILGYSFREDNEDLIDYDIRACVTDIEAAKALSADAVMLDKDVYVHIALDTGMSRIGFQPDETSVEQILAIASLPHVKVEGLFTHFARADEKDIAHYEAQFAAYREFRKLLEEKGLEIPICHVANSAALMRFRDASLDMVRCGITLYGLMPSAEIKDEVGALRPAMRLISHITHVKTLPAGREISYGGTYVTSSERRIATVPVGYGDGYPRALSSKGKVLIGGSFAPIVGRVCMDQFMVDVTDIPGEISVGDEVVLLGRSGENEITCQELGDLSGRFPYEFVCDISKRVPKVFFLHGMPVEAADPFHYS